MSYRTEEQRIVYSAVKRDCWMSIAASMKVEPLRRTPVPSEVHRVRGAHTPRKAGTLYDSRTVPRSGPTRGGYGLGLVWFGLYTAKNPSNRPRRQTHQGGSFDFLRSMGRTYALVAQTVPLFRSARTGLIAESAMFRFVQLGHPSLRVGVGFGFL